MSDFEGKDLNDFLLCRERPAFRISRYITQYFVLAVFYFVAYRYVTVKFVGQLVLQARDLEPQYLDCQL